MLIAFHLSRLGISFPTYSMKKIIFVLTLLSSASFHPVSAQTDPRPKMDAYLNSLDLALKPVMTAYSMYKRSLSESDSFEEVKTKGKTVVGEAAKAIRNVKNITPYRNELLSKNASLKLLQEMYNAGKKEFPKINALYSEKSALTKEKRNESALKKLEEAMSKAIDLEIDLQKKNRLFYRRFYADSAAADFCLQLAPLYADLVNNFLSIKGDSLGIFPDGAKQYRMYSSTLSLPSSPAPGRVIHLYVGDTLIGASAEYYFFYRANFEAAKETFDIISLFMDTCYPEKAESAYDESVIFDKQNVDRGEESVYPYRFQEKNTLWRVVLRNDAQNNYLVFIDLSYGFYE